MATTNKILLRDLENIIPTIILILNCPLNKQKHYIKHLDEIVTRLKENLDGVVDGL